MISCSNVTKDETSYCCDGTINCCERGVGRFSVLPSNPTPTATWDDLRTRFMLVVTSSSSSSQQSSSRLSSVSPPPSSSSRRTESSTRPESSDTSTTSTTASRTESITIVDNSNATEIPTGASENTTTLSTGAKAGIGVGAAVGVGLVAAIFYLIWKLRRKDRIASQVPTYYTGMQPTPQQIPVAEYYGSQAGKSEPSEVDPMGSRGAAHELPGTVPH